MRSYVDGFVRRTGIPVDVEVDPDFSRLDPNVETALFRIVQEGLVNIHRHSGSPDGALRLTRRDGRIELRIEDHGTGLAPEVVKESGTGILRMGVGLAGMRERAAEMGGRMEVIASQKGTTVVVSLPGSECKPVAAFGDRQPATSVPGRPSELIADC